MVAHIKVATWDFLVNTELIVPSLRQGSVHDTAVCAQLLIQRQPGTKGHAWCAVRECRAIPRVANALELGCRVGSRLGRLAADVVKGEQQMVLAAKK
jgi:hypothetical protein